KGADISFVDKISHPQSFRALNFNPRYKALVTRLKSMPHHSLGDICAGGDLGAGARFKRIDADPEYGVKLVGQKQGFWSRPVGRWISANHAPADIFVKDETVLIAAQGTLGENEVFCRPLFITGKWLDYVYTQHFIRVRSGDLDISGAYLFAFFRSETAFRCLRSMSIGSKQQDIHLDMLKEFPVPVLDRDIRKEIEEMVKEAFELRDDADNRENEAVALVESAIEQYRLP
ncbi:MAG: restriction endonuclease subunit S, partial [Gammaproteobacteria bacterium]|nr:restriction endonuclease subunit S [Gammaproteobacteria bacterium]